MKLIDALLKGFLTLLYIAAVGATVIGLLYAAEENLVISVIGIFLLLLSIVTGIYYCVCDNQSIKVKCNLGGEGNEPINWCDKCAHRKEHDPQQLCPGGTCCDLELCKRSQVRCEAVE